MKYYFECYHEYRKQHNRIQVVNNKTMYFSVYLNALDEVFATRAGFQLEEIKL